MNISKLIPAYIQIRSLYWVKIEKSMDNRLVAIFDAIDCDKYETADILIKEFYQRFDGMKYPKWVESTYAEITRVSTMLNFLKTDL
jgi:hypothetical protein